MSKINIRKDFTAAKRALKDLMQEHVAVISEDLISQIMYKYKIAIPSEQINSVKGNKVRGTQAYKDALRNALSTICLESMNQARTEVPKKKNVRLAEWNCDSVLLGEFERLPPSVQKRILAQSQLLIDTQMGDLEKATYFQFTSSVESTDSFNLIKADLEEAALDYIEGASIEAGSGTVAADFINTARNAFFFDDEVLEEIEAFQFVNGDPVSPICEDLAGTIFAKDDPEAERYFPPLHHNCKSFLSAILVGNLKGREIDDLKPSDSDLDKYVTL